MNLNIHKNEVFCLFGGNGAGKTTLINLLIGITKPEEGTILSKIFVFLNHI